MSSERAALPRTPAERLALQSQIARSRLRIERRVGRLVDRSLLCGAWRTYVQDHPGRSLLAAAGTGLALSTLLARLPFPGDSIQRLADLALGAGWSRTLSELRAALHRAANETPPDPASPSASG